MAISIVTAPAFSWGTLGLGAAAGAVGAPLIPFLLKHVIVRPVAQLMADGEDAYQEARAAKQRQLQYAASGYAASGVVPTPSGTSVQLTFTGIPPETITNLVNSLSTLAHSISESATAPARGRGSRTE